MDAAEAAAEPVSSKKPHFLVPDQASTIRKSQSKSHSNYLCKSIVAVLVLLVIPLFPTQAPEFITQSILTELWEIFHLLFIGIAVSYGLFSRKTAQVVPEKTLHSRNDDSQPNLSGISHLSSIFEDGFENLYEPGDEQSLMQSYVYSRCLQGSNVRFLGEESCEIDEATKIKSFVPKGGMDNICEDNGKRVNQAWRFRQTKGDSVVVVSEGKHFLDECTDYMPLNLPVRSLRSKVINKDKLESKHTRERSLEDGKSCKGNDRVNVQKIRGVAPINLEKKFADVAGASSIPWRSRSGRMELREESINLSSPPRIRGLPLGEFNLENLKSRSFRGSMLCSSHQVSSSKVENMENKKDVENSTTSVSQPKIGPQNSEAPLVGGKARPLSIGSSSEINWLRNSETILKNSGNHGKDDVIGKEKKPVGLLNSDKESSTPSKVVSRSKSVRTIKPIRYNVDEKEQCMTHIDGQVNYLLKRARGEKLEHLPVEPQKQDNFDCPFPMPKLESTLHEFHSKKYEDIDDTSVVDSTEDTESESNKSSDEDDTRTDLENGAELEGSEVDRKAGEFIAKFREQIRLQKMSSAKGYSGW